MGNPFQVEEVKERIRQYNQEKYGVDHFFQSAEGKAKLRASLKEKTGFEFPLQSAEAKAKFVATCLLRYGVDHPMQDSAIADKAHKNAFGRKDYVFPSGRTDSVQGFEKFALDILVKDERIEERDIVTARSEVPSVWYKTSDGKDHRYFVDIYIPSQKRMIEVKSPWTYSFDKERVLLKVAAAESAGYRCDLWVFDKNGNMVDVDVEDAVVDAVADEVAEEDFEVQAALYSMTGQEDSLTTALVASAGASSSSDGSNGAATALSEAFGSLTVAGSAGVVGCLV